jgi:hypothetical protein
VERGETVDRSGWEWMSEEEQDDALASVLWSRMSPEVRAGVLATMTVEESTGILPRGLNHGRRLVKEARRRAQGGGA